MYVDSSITSLPLPLGLLQQQFQHLSFMLWTVGHVLQLHHLLLTAG